MIKLLLLFTFIYSCSSKKTPLKLDDSIQASLNRMRSKSINYGVSLSGQRKFIDKTERYGLTGLKASNISAVDFNSDGYTDLVFIPEPYSQPLFYLFDPVSSKFKLIDSPLSRNIKASYLIFEDFNKDSVIDVLVGVLSQRTELNQSPIRILYGNNKSITGLKFEKEVKVFNKPLPSATVSLIDYDLDGDLDFFIGNWFEEYKGKPLPSKDFFVVNDKGSYQVNLSKLVGEEDKNLAKKMFKNASPTIGSQACDIDQNGYPDILTSSTNGFPNALWINLFKFRKDYRYFKNYGIESRYSGDSDGSLTQTGGGRSFVAACADYNNDTIMDIFMGEVTHSYDSEVKDKSSILTGSRKKFPPVFYRTEYVLDSHDITWTQADKRAVWFDYNNDGLLDLLVDNSGYPPHSRLILFKQLADHSFENVSKELGIDFVNPQASIVLDVNKDGRMDILSSRTDLRDANIKRRIYLFENNIKNPNRSFKIQLKGNKSNPSGIGATVMARIKKVDGKIETRRHVVSYSYGALPPQNESGIHFGLAKGEELVYVKVRWPFAKDLNQTAQKMEQTYRFSIKKYGHTVVQLKERN